MYTYIFICIRIHTHIHILYVHIRIHIQRQESLQHIASRATTACNILQPICEPGFCHSSARFSRGFVVSANLHHTCWSFYRGNWQSPQISTILRKTSTRIAQTNLKCWLAKFPRRHWRKSALQEIWGRTWSADGFLFRATRFAGSFRRVLLGPKRRWQHDE